MRLRADPAAPSRVRVLRMVAALLLCVSLAAAGEVTIHHDRSLLGARIHATRTFDAGTYTAEFTTDANAAAGISPRHEKWTCSRSRNPNWDQIFWITVDPDGTIVLEQGDCRDDEGTWHSAGNALLDSCDTANRVAAELQISRNACQNRAVAARPAPPPAAAAPASPSVPRICSDGSPMPANSVCPTITFPGPAERQRQAEAQQRAQREANERAAYEDQARRAVAAQQQRDQQELDAALSQLTQVPPLPAPARPVAAFRPVDDVLDESVQTPAVQPDADAPLAPVWRRVTQWMDKALTSLPGCRADLADRNLCRMVVFGPLGMPGAMDDMRDTIVDGLQQEANP